MSVAEGSQIEMDESEDEHSLQRTLSISTSTQTSDTDTQPSPRCTSPFCLHLKSITPFPLVTFTRPKSDVVRQGYLGWQERSHLQYFVLRSGSHTGPSRLEWYENRETFVEMQSGGGAVLFGANKQGMIYLSRCLAVNRIGSAPTGLRVVLYSKEQKLALAVEDKFEQDDWYQSIKSVMEQEQQLKKEHEKVLEVEDEEEEEEDDGYWTLPPAAFFREVWAVTVQPTGLGCRGSLAGESRLCLTASSLLLVRLNTSSYSPPVDFPLPSIRRFGHSPGSFYMELGRSAPRGPGEIWMELKDKGNAAQRIHEKVRVAIRELRALPDFGRSPPCSGHKRSTLKCFRRKCGDKPSNPKSPRLRLSLSPKSPSTSWSSSPRNTASPTTPLRTASQNSDDYVEMKVVELPRRERERWEGGEEESNYMVMSPQPRYSLPVCPPEDYTPMEGPEEEWSPGPSHCMSMDSAPSGYESPRSPKARLTACQSDIGSSCIAGRQWFTLRRRSRCRLASDIGSQSVTTGPDQAGSTSGSGWFSRHRAAPPNSPGRRSRLSLFCLPLALWGRKK